MEPTTSAEGAVGEGAIGKDRASEELDQFRCEVTERLVKSRVK